MPEFRLEPRRRLAGGFLALALGGVGAFAPAQSPAPPTADELAAAIPESTALSDGTVRIPFELKGNKIYVETTVNGKGPFPFIFDTGASGTVLDASLTEELGLELVGKSDIGDPTESARIPVDLVWVGEMSLGGFSATGFQASSWDRSNLYQHMNVPPKGIVGFPVFHDVLLTIDYEAQELVVTKGVLSSDDEHVIPYVAPMGIAELKCAVNGKTITTHIDTGGPHGIMVPPEMLDDDAIEGDPVVIGRARTVNSDFEIKAVHLTGVIEFAGYRVENPVILLNELYPGVNLGYDFLRHFRLTFDQANRLVRLEAVSDEPITLGMPPVRHGGHKPNG